jgi:hypothetical protein
MVPANIDQASSEKSSLALLHAVVQCKLRFSRAQTRKYKKQVTVEAVPTLLSISLEMQIKGRGEDEMDDQKAYSDLLRHFILRISTQQSSLLLLFYRSALIILPPTTHFILSRQVR